MDLINNILSGSRSAGNTASDEGKHYVTTGGGGESSVPREGSTGAYATPDPADEQNAQIQQYLADTDKWLSNRAAQGNVSESDTNNVLLWLLLPIAAFVMYKKFGNGKKR